jgi:DNA polymerase III subunit beta
MRITIKQKDFAVALKKCAAVCAKSSTIPILGNVLMSLDAGRLHLTATDLTVWVRTSAAAAGDGGSISVPASKLLEVVGLMADAPILLETTDKDFVKLSSGRSRSKIAGMAAASFPELPKDPKPKLSAPTKELLEMFSRLAPVISRDTGSFTYEAARLEQVDGELRMVATDGHRIAVCSLKCDLKPVKMEIPMAAMAAYLKLAEAGDDPTEIGMDDNHIFLRHGQDLLIARKQVGQFPDWERMIPKSHEQEFTINAADMKQAITRVCPLAESGKGGSNVGILFDNEEVIFRCVSLEGEAEECLPLKFEGPRTKLAFEPKYLLDFLSPMGSKPVKIGIVNKGTAFHCASPDGDFTYVVAGRRTEWMSQW